MSKVNNIPIRVEVFSSPGCSKCNHAKDVLRQLVKKIDASKDDNKIEWREVNILDELDYAVSLGVMTTPSIAINGELIFSSLPSVKILRTELEKRLQG